MPEPNLHEVTQLLLAWSEGDRAALDRLVPLVYAELRQLAKSHMRRERAGQTMQTTALIHEAYLRLIDADCVRLENRAHFFAAAARVMRQVLVDLARERGSRKRGGAARRGGGCRSMRRWRSANNTTRGCSRSMRRSKRSRKSTRAKARWSSCASSAG